MSEPGNPMVRKHPDAMPKIATDASLTFDRAGTAHYGFFTITAVPDEKTFEVELREDPRGDAISGYYGALWQARRVVIENNVIDLASGPTTPGPAPPVGVALGGKFRFYDPSELLQVMIRGNTVRHLDGLPEPGDLATGIFVARCAEALVENNIIDLVEPVSIRHLYTQVIRSFNNQTSSGQTLHAYDLTPPAAARLGRELKDEIEAVALLAL